MASFVEKIVLEAVASHMPRKNLATRIILKIADSRSRSNKYWVETAALQYLRDAHTIGILVLTRGTYVLRNPSAPTLRRERNLPAL